MLVIPGQPVVTSVTIYTVTAAQYLILLLSIPASTGNCYHHCHTRTQRNSYHKNRSHKLTKLFNRQILSRLPVICHGFLNYTSDGELSYDNDNTANASETYLHAIPDCVGSVCRWAALCTQPWCCPPCVGQPCAALQHPNEDHIPHVCFLNFITLYYSTMMFYFANCIVCMLCIVLHLYAKLITYINRLHAGHGLNMGQTVECILPTLETNRHEHYVKSRWAGVI